MSRENLIHTLRDALETLTQKVRQDEGDIVVPDVDEIMSLVGKKPRRRIDGPPLFW